jgi:hypothetical protein
MGIVLATGNTYLLVSTDGGGNFTQINPTTLWPTVDGGICCDQVVIYNPSINLFFWVLQYQCSPANVGCNPPPPPPGTPPITAGTVSQNRLRIAFASPEAIRTNISNLRLAFTYFDLQPSNFKLPNHWFDYPDIAFTNSNLYVSATSYALPGVADRSSGRGFIVVRKALAEISSLAAQPGPVPGSTPVGFFSPNSPATGNSKTDTSWKQAISDTGSSRLTQSSADAMYWAGHKDTSTLHFWEMRDADDRTRHSIVNNNKYSNNTADYSSTAPDGNQWTDNRQKSPGTDAVLGATRLGDQVWFAWDAGRNNSAGRPQPYIQIAGIDIRTLKQVGAYDIWNSSYAFAYPSLATGVGGNRVENIAVSLAWGGRPSNNYGSTAVGFLGDHVVYYTELSDATDTINPKRFGDFFVVRRFDRPGGGAFSSQGYAVRLVNPSMSTSCATTPGCTFHPHYVEWRRPLIE